MKKYLIILLLCIFSGSLAAVFHYHPTEVNANDDANVDKKEANNGHSDNSDNSMLDSSESGCDIRSYFDCVTDSVKEKIMAYEGCSLKARRDSHGRWQIGYGHTLGVKRGDRISEPEARRLFEKDLALITHYINELEICHTQNEFDALVCLVYNVGITQFSESDLKHSIENYGTPRHIRKQFLRWVYAYGRPCKGLIKRRQWECDLFLLYA